MCNVAASWESWRQGEAGKDEKRARTDGGSKQRKRRGREKGRASEQIRREGEGEDGEEGEHA